MAGPGDTVPDLTGGNTTPPGKPGSPASPGSPAKPGKKADALTPATLDQKKGWKDRWERAYRDLTNSNAPIPAALLKLIVAAKGVYSTDALMTWVRKNDQKHWLTSDIATKRRIEMIRSLKAIFGDDYKVNDDMKGLLLKFMIADPDKTDFIGFFRKVIAKSQTFKTQFPGFSEWYDVASRTTSFASSSDAILKFKEARDHYEGWYRQLMNTLDVDPAFITAALTGAWDETQFKLNLQSGTTWQTTIGAPRDEEFKRNWDSIFQNTKYEGVYNATLLARYRTGTMDFQTLINTDIKDMPEIAELYPEYAAWEEKQHSLGVPEDRVNIFSYLTEQGDMRQEFGMWYKEMMGDTEAVIPPDLLKRAMDGNWSRALFEVTFKKTDPGYKQTDTYKNDVASFALYWKQVFGENSVPDADLASVYASGSYSNPIQLFDQVKKTREFQLQYGNWDAFAAAQHSAGASAMTDPLLYNEYKTAFYNAFADMGMQAPAELEKQFFASGEGTTDFTEHVQLFSKTKEAYNWQTGQTPEMATATDLGNKTSGGDLRKKMAEALLQQKAYMSSKFESFQTQEKAGNLVQKV